MSARASSITRIFSCEGLGEKTLLPSGLALNPDSMSRPESRAATPVNAPAPAAISLSDKVCLPVFFFSSLSCLSKAFITSSIEVSEFSAGFSCCGAAFSAVGRGAGGRACPRLTAGSERSSSGSIPSSFRRALIRSWISASVMAYHLSGVFGI